jgi:pyrimidine nucleoside transport protein
VLWGVSLQFIFGLAILRWSFGKDIFKCIGEKISIFLEFTDEGSSFIFGYLVTGVLSGNVTIETDGNLPIKLSLPTQAAIFAFKV